MTIEEFLTRRGTDLAHVLAKVHAEIGLRAGDVLIAVGSLAENMGTSKSDMDLLLITPRSKKSLPPHDNMALVVGRCLVDVRILSQARIQELLNRLAAWSRLPWNVTHAVKFTLDERTLLHRLLHGCVLYLGANIRMAQLTPSRIHLARLKLHVARQMARTIQVDMIGYREVGDYSSLVFAAQEVLGHTTDALAAGHALTNPLIKWRSRMLELMPENWEGQLGVRPTALSAAQRIWALHRAPQRPEKKLCLRYALEITTFARAAFIWAERRLLNPGRSLRAPSAWPQLPCSSTSSPLPHLDYDVDFVAANGKITLARLNEFDRILEIPRRDLALVLLFDGKTTLQEAEIIVGGSPVNKSRLRISNLVSQIAEAGFSVSPQA